MAEITRKERLEQTHPTYQHFLPDWLFFLDSYMGGEAYRQKRYLFKHEKENEADYQNRLQRATFTNFCRKVIDIHAGFIFQKPIERHTEDPQFREFEKDADRRGTPLTQLMAEQVGKLGMAVGHTVVIVDAPPDANASRSRAEDLARGLRPYVTVYNPTDVVDWAKNDDGSFRWIRVQESAPDMSGPFDARPEPTKLYRVWDEEKWETFTEDGVRVGAGMHGLGEVPAVLIPAGEHALYRDVGQSHLVDIAPMNRAHYNYQSLLDEGLYLQTFNTLAFPTDKELPPEKIRSMVKETGTKKGFFYPATAGPPSYVSPPSDPARLLMEVIEATARSITEMAKLQDRKSSANEKSGVAHMYEFQEANAAFAKLAKNLEDGERQIVRLYYKWLKRTPDVEVSYPTDFNLSTLADTIDETLSKLTLNISDTFNAEVKKRFVPIALPNLDPKTEKAIKDEIEAPPVVDPNAELDALANEPPAPDAPQPPSDSPASTPPEAPADRLAA